MIRVALTMLVNDRAKYAGLLFGITFTSFLVTFATGYFSGMMTRGYALISDIPSVDVWVMDPAVRSVDLTTDMPESALDQVRSLAGVEWALPLTLASTRLRFPDGRFQPVQVIAVDEASLLGLPPLHDAEAPSLLRSTGYVAVDDGGSSMKLQTPLRPADSWPVDPPGGTSPTRHLRKGDEILANDTLVRVAGVTHGLPRYPPRPILFATRATAFQFLPPERHRLTFVLVHAASGMDVDRLAQSIAAATGLRARSTREFAGDTVRWTLAHSEDTGDAVTMLTIAILVGFGVTGIMLFLFTSENLQCYAVFAAMGASLRQRLGMVFAQTAVCSLLGTGMGLGISVLVGRVFAEAGFPFRLLWFAPVAGTAAVLLVSLAATAWAVGLLSRLQLRSLLESR